MECSLILRHLTKVRRVGACEAVGLLIRVVSSRVFCTSVFTSSLHMSVPPLLRDGIPESPIVRTTDRWNGLRSESLVEFNKGIMTI
jgi:hypothetical protein